ncbi:gastrula zinc finger protein XlCGF46.1 [Anabrus simplex]|uniref:gastrula zinc finger protein XlCGF46.1 n=1 Tax=Anabrus simplex TaxID=316456 RepID=UPI0035A2EABB
MMESETGVMDSEMGIKIEAVWHMPEEENILTSSWEADRTYFPTLSTRPVKPQWMSADTIPITFPLWNLKSEMYTGNTEQKHIANKEDGIVDNELREFNSFETYGSLLLSQDACKAQLSEENEDERCKYMHHVVNDFNATQHEENSVSTLENIYPREKIKKLPLKEKPYVCRECNTGYSSKLKFQKHIKKHTGENLTCQICHITFPSKIKLKKHSSLHSEECEYKCKKCDSSFSSKPALLGHSRTHAEDKCFRCKICGRWFTTRTGLRNHSDIHSARKLFKCTKCNKEYGTRSGLKYHLSTHNPDKFFSCFECHKRFMSKQSLQHHVLSHNRKKNFKCDDCEKRFFTKGQLRHHEKNHDSGKTFQCKKCAKSFTTKQGFVYHMRTHVWERTVPCIVCDKRIKETNAFRCSFISQTENESFKCNFCRNCFRSNMSAAEDKECSD